MPGVSDPGYELIGAASRTGIPVIPIPGPSAVITALVVSGLPTDRFLYLGFLPRRASARKQALKSVVQETGTLVILEAPHRLQQALNDLRLVLGDRQLAVCRELTKLHEEVFRGTISQAIDRFTEPRGELTLVIEGKREEKPQKSNKIIEERLRDMYQSGVKAKEAIARVAGETGLSRRELYRTWLKMNKVADENQNPCHSLERS
jgi:16S rRNA (cytidine1402-2'-O)-methyltransferase